MPTQQPADESGAIAKLEAALEHIKKGLFVRIEFAESETDLMAATNALLRAMVWQGEAILAVSRTQFASACTPNVRTMFEAWCDFRLILEQGDRNENGRRFRVFGLLELRDYAFDLRSTGRDYGGLSDEVEKELAVYLNRHSGLVATIEAERKKKRNSWSGKSRIAMLRALDKNTHTKPKLVDTYRVLSWDSHNSVTGVLDVSTGEDESGQMRVRFHRRSEDASEKNCALAERLLGDAWLKFRRAFDLDSAKTPVRTS